MEQTSFSEKDNNTLEFLKSIRLFQELEDKALKHVLRCLEIRTFMSGEKLFNQGDPPDGIYVVMTGRLFFEKKISEYGNIRTLRGEFSRGSIIGEISILTGQTRSADVIAYRDSELIYISTSILNELLHKFPDSFLNVIHVISSNRQKPDSTDLNIPLRMISVMPLSRDVDYKPFVEELARSLGRFGNVNVIHQSAIAQKNPSEIRELLHRLEKGSNFTIFDTSFDEEWTDFCLSHSDRVVVVDRQDGTGDLRSDEAYCQETHPRLLKDLVLLTESKLGYLDTDRWTAKRSIQRKFLVSRRELGGVSRLARHIAGNTLGIAFGGGGARGFAHIGVMQELQKLGVEVDMVAGTSMGSIVGALFALEMDHNEIMEKMNRYFVDRNPTGDFHLSPISLTKGKIFTDSIQEVFHEKLIQHSSIPYYAVACNFLESSLKVFDEGKIWEAIRASSSIPGLSPPLLVGDSVYIDGGLLNNLPCDILKDRGANQVIGIDVTGNNSIDNSRIKSYLSKLKPGESPSFIDGWKQTAQEFLHGEETPILMELLVGSGMVGSKLHQQSIKGSIDLMLTPGTQNYGLLEWKKLEELIQVGRDCVNENKDAILALR